MLSSAAAYRLRMLLAVMAATVVLVLAVVAVVLVISAGDLRVGDRQRRRLGRRLLIPVRRI